MKVIIPKVPEHYLSKMGSYSVDMNGSRIDVKVVDDPRFVGTTFERLVSGLTAPNVIGIDDKLPTYDVCDNDNDSKDDDDGDHRIVVLCANSFCLVIHRSPASESLLPRLLNDPEICVVMPLADVEFRDMHVQQLAARVLKKPSLCRSSFAEICKEVGVQHWGSATGKMASIPVESRCPTILSEEQVKAVISDAYACQRVGSKLLASL